MSTYKNEDRYISRVLGKLSGEERAAARLKIDVRNLLVGPTCGDKADRLAESIFATSTPREVALVLKEAAERYLAACDKTNDSK